MENGKQLNLSPDMQKQYNDFNWSIKNMRKEVNKLEGQLAHLFNHQKDKTVSVSGISTEMQKTTKSILKIEDTIENLEKEKNKLLQNSNTEEKTPENNTQQFRHK